MKVSAALLGIAMVAIGCHRPHGTILGKAPSGNVQTIIAVRAGDTPQQVTLSGTLTEKCPVAGCWFRLHDDTGTIKIDTKAAGFVVSAVPLETKITVAGKITDTEEEVIIEATGVRY